MQRAHHVLVVGSGSIGERHIRCFLATGRARVSFVEVKSQLREQVNRQFRDCVAHESVDQAMATQPSAAVIATPAPLHVPQAIRLAEQGCHLLIEKPLSLSTAGTAQLQEIVSRRQLIAGVAYVHRANPVLADMRDAITAGEFGRPFELVAVTGQHFPFYRPAYRETYYTRRETGGGAVQDALTHLINVGHWLVGPAQRVVADAAHCALPGVEVEDTVHVLARHGEVLGSYNLNQHQAPNELTVTVICERGTARFEAHTGSWKVMTNPNSDWTTRSAAQLERDIIFTRQAHAFLDAIEGKVQPLCTLPDAIHSLRMTLAILESIDSRAWREVRESDHADG